MAASFQPGDLVRGFAGNYRLPVTELSILVEGEHDQRYFSLANRLYQKDTGLSLLGGKLSAFPTGIGEDGGSYGLQRHFHPLRAIMDCDMTSQGKKVFHAIALFDNDIKGRQGFSALTGQHLNYKPWRDVFLLQRVLPRTTRDYVQMPGLVEAANSKWKGMHCEIEDLVSGAFVKCFIDENPTSIFKDLEEKDGAIHCFFKDDAKTKFVRFSEANAMLGDLLLIVDFLKSLRFHLGLDPDGQK